jgi:hypothetical protein
LNELVANFVPTTNGVIWIEGGGASVTTAPVIIDGTPVTGNWKTAAGFALTFKGGWNGPGTTITDPLDPALLTHSLTITNWTGAITLSDIVISDVTAGTALSIETKGTINLTRVQVGTVRNDSTGPNTGAGAVLNNTTGAGNVLVTGSTFSYNNGGDGLNIRTLGTITLTDVTAEFNNGDGADLDNCKDTGGGVCTNTTADLVNLTGTNIFSDNVANGLVVVSRGSISINNLIANGNDGAWGASLNNTYATTALGVKLTGSSQLKHNDGGLYILSKGAITLNNVNASGNTVSNGALLQNIASTVSSVVTLTGTNIFNDNFSTGLIVNSKGIITLYNVTANGNTGYGALLDNYQAGAVTTAKSVILYGASSFNGNYNTGLDITSRGLITLNKITANGNTSASASGVRIHNDHTLLTAPQNVTILGYLTANDNGYRGLDLWSFGALTLYNVTTNGNGEYGTYLDNCTTSGTGCTVNTAKAIVLYGTNTFNGNTGDGLHVLSKGAITLTNLTANGNKAAPGYGVYLENDRDGAVGGVTLTNASTFSASISNNAGNGLTIYSRGAITIKDLDAIENGSSGVYLNNLNTTSTLGSNVTVGTLRLNWINNFDWNNGTGLAIYSEGVVTLYNLSASSNKVGNGLVVDNVGSGTPKAVSLLGAGWFDDNAMSGMLIDTQGLVTLNKISASGNGEDGAVIANDTVAAVPQNVTLNGYGWFNGNGNDGLRVTTFGLITLNNVTANENGKDLGVGGFGWGVHLDNYHVGETLATLPRGVTLNGTNVFNDNFQDGLWVESIGIIRANNLSADGNLQSGALLNNKLGILDQAVILTGTNFFTNNSSGVGTNDGYGLQVYSNGAITINNLNAISNFNGGAYLENISTINLTLLPSIVTLTGTNNFLDNGTTGDVSTEHGLKIVSHGSITINSLTANGNNGTGAWLVNYHGIAAPTSPFIKLTGINTFNNNAGGQWGLRLQAGGLVDVTKVTADGNGNGVYIGSQGNITVTCGSMTGNNAFGWQIDAATGGIITLKGVFSYGNGTNADTSDLVTYVRACPLP